MQADIYTCNVTVLLCVIIIYICKFNSSTKLKNDISKPN